ncbi:MAG: lytic transglycosylase domain-containing protein [Pseudomonadota bacterium]
MAGLPAAAQAVFTPPPERDFTFRSVAPPGGAGGDRLVFGASPGASPGTAEAGFWAAVSPDRDAAGPDRLNRVAAAQGAALLRRWPPAEARQAARRVLARHAGAFAAGARGGRVSRAMLVAVALSESGGDPNAVSPKGAEGLMQLMPSTARRFGVADAFDPNQAAPAAAAYLDELLRRFGEDPVLALAAYNAGEGAVERHGGVPPFDETRAYVPRALAAWLALTETCPPEARRPRRDCLDPGLAPAAARQAVPAGPRAPSARRGPLPQVGPGGTR